LPPDRREAARVGAPGGFRCVIDGIAGIVLTHLSGMAARCSNDLVVRRKIDAVVYEVLKRWRKSPLRWPKNGEPPLEKQADN